MINYSYEIITLSRYNHTGFYINVAKDAYVNSVATDGEWTYSQIVSQSVTADHLATWDSGSGNIQPWATLTQPQVFDWWTGHTDIPALETSLSASLAILAAPAVVEYPPLPWTPEP